VHAAGWSLTNLVTGKGRVVAMNQAFSLLSLAGFACFKGRKTGPSPFLFLGLALMAWLLCLGPQGGVYTAVYGLHPVLQRFWWPMRHAIILTVMIAALATRAVPPSWEKRAWPVLLLVLSIPLSLRAQGLMVQAKTSPIAAPKMYQDLAKKPGDILLQTPLNPRLTTVQTPLITQLYHKKKMLNGHAPWVDRVRPAAWDTLIQNNSFLAALSAYEAAEISGKVQFKVEDFQALRDLGLRYLVVDQEFYLLKLRGLVKGERAAFQKLFGSPILQSKRSWVFDTAQWNEEPSFDFPEWTWPKDLRRGRNGQAINGRRPASVLFPPSPPKNR
jgi:hypothetical protein